MNGNQVMDTEDFLEHYGVKGMKWGVRRNRDDSTPKTPSKGKQHDMAVKAARRNVRDQKKALKTASKEVRKTTEKGTAERAKAENKLLEQKVAFLNNPDRATAIQLTRGERVVNTLLSSPGGAFANEAVRIARVETIKYKQETGAYNKKLVKK